MCPACMATVLMVAAGTASAGGLSAALFKRARAKSALSILDQPDSLVGDGGAAEVSREIVLERRRAARRSSQARHS